MAERRADAALCVKRFGHGARPGDLAVLAGDPRGALLEDMARHPRGDAAGDGLPTSAEAFSAVRMKAAEAAAVDGVPVPRRILEAEVAWRAARVRDAPTGVVERLVGFWANHFCIAARASGPLRAMAGAYEREAIRPHVLGRFADMLAAVTRHPAMLLYLDNAASIGPDSPAGQRRGRGLNENHARELLELHTVGVAAGYGQDDVRATAKVLTGWSVQRDPNQPGDAGRFVFRAAAHEPGPQAVMGRRYGEAGLSQGMALLADLAAHPATARHVAAKLARHFVADVPPTALVDRLARVFLDTGGDLAAMARALIGDDLAWRPEPAKLRTPQEFVWAAVRALGLDEPPTFLLRCFAALGQPLWDPPAPAGFDDTAATWLTPAGLTARTDLAGRLAARARLADPRSLPAGVLGAALSPTTAEAIARAESPLQGRTLFLMSPDFQRR